MRSKIKNKTLILLRLCHVLLIQCKMRKIPNKIDVRISKKLFRLFLCRVGVFYRLHIMDG